MRLDKRGLEGMPLKLLVGFLLIALMMPAVADSLSAYQRGMAIGELGRAVRQVKSAAQSCFLSGPGNVRTIDINADQRGNAIIQLGGARGSLEPPDITASLDGSTVVREHMLDPRITIVVDGGKPIALHFAHERLLLECVVDGSDVFVRARVMPR